MPRIKNPQQLHDFVTQFISAATAHSAEIPTVTAPHLATLATNNAALAAFITAKLAADDAAKAATQALAAGATLVNDGLDAEVLLVRSTPAVADATITDLGLPLRDTVPTTVIPVAPSELSVRGFDTGINRLVWKSGGNLRGVSYIVEYRVGSTGPFLFLDVTSKTTMDHAGQTPGQRVEYRVKAKRTTHESAYSNTAVVYA